MKLDKYKLNVVCTSCGICLRQSRGILCQGLCSHIISVISWFVLYICVCVLGRKSPTCRQWAMCPQNKC